MANKKQSFKLQNTTNYFDPETTRTYNTVSSPYSYQSRQMKIEGYETRLYWQYRYCDEHNGQTFFYTLTYNDRHMPTFYGQRCFDYEDLRDLFTGGFRKQLLRKYGSTFKYFVGAELGDGKGERGLHNNPHYHILFFLEDAHNERFPYVKIDPKDFRHLVRIYWQGFDEEEGFHDYRDARKGIAREGDNLGLVTDFRACMYCAKYVCKDVKLKHFERKVEDYLREDLIEKYYDEPECHKAFFDEFIRENFYKIADTDRELVMKTCGLDPSTFELKRRIAENGSILIPAWTPDVTNVEPFFAGMLKTLDLDGEYRLFVGKYIVPILHEYMNEYRNRYCNKCRISQGVGDYAISHIEDKLNPTIQVPAKKGFKNRPISMYYYRKMYMDAILDEAVGNTRYILNEDGIRYKMAHLDERLQKTAEKALVNLNLVLGDASLYEKMRESDVNTRVFSPYNEFFENTNYLLSEYNKELITSRYAQYKLIYEDRYFSYRSRDGVPHGDFPILNPHDDYLRYISSVGCLRNDFRVHFFLEDGHMDYVSFDSHPDFLCFLGIFAVLDLCADYFFVKTDDKNQREAEERAAVKRFHDQMKMKEFYKHFE